MPYRAIKTNIADSLDVIVQIERRPGIRFVSEVVEIGDYNLETDIYDCRPIYQSRPSVCPPIETTPSAPDQTAPLRSADLQGVASSENASG
jgi:hypothetical protein